MRGISEIYLKRLEDTIDRAQEHITECQRKIEFIKKNNPWCPYCKARYSWGAFEFNFKGADKNAEIYVVCPEGHEMIVRKGYKKGSVEFKDVMWVYEVLEEWEDKED